MPFLYVVLSVLLQTVQNPFRIKKHLRRIVHNQINKTIPARNLQKQFVAQLLNSKSHLLFMPNTLYILMTNCRVNDVCLNSRTQTVACSSTWSALWRKCSSQWDIKFPTLHKTTSHNLCLRREMTWPPWVRAPWSPPEWVRRPAASCREGGESAGPPLWSYRWPDHRWSRSSETSFVLQNTGIAHRNTH